ncbi:polysaccharide deacetylase family protein [Gimesia aquarii]|uniref:Peptidoglycan-N-acetylmuramic acid deacetylase PdaC n=1 Tax=Gimesia aquarii TaxID=2527964 RepID=A0A517VWC6_9PLAN|nr:polysaccharide deacetylase family protein [Gimesia aquarii]QDT97297.1 Peptidoglycan-N-acetylmuramic acid deacetylase PdaC [Gimesia aquarii]
MNPIRQLIKKTISAVIPQKLFLVHGAPRQNTNRSAINISFTFDDGPHPEYTPQLLDLLNQYQQRGTFFVIGEKAQQYPELIERIINEGHEIGNHTFTHQEPSQSSTRCFLDEIKQTDQTLKQITGIETNLVRPPKGKLSLGKMLGLWLQHRTVVLWDTDPRDYLMSDLAEMKNWCQHYHPVEGNFCLLHDNHPYAIEAVRQLSEHQEFQIQSHTVSHWLAPKGDQAILTQQASA